MMSAYEGLAIHCVTSGRQAIELIREEKLHYDIVFMDHMMPELDGLETVRIIREEIGTEYAKTVPIVALTANAIVGNDKLFLERGFQGFLTKPIDVVRLDTVLRTWIRNRQSEETLRRAEAAMPPPMSGKKRVSLMEGLLAKTRVRGVDFSGGMRRFNGNVETFLRVIRSFVKNMPKFLTDLRGVSEGNLAPYAVLIHGVKGSCYGISADEAGRMAEALEVAAKTGDFARVMAGNETFIRTVEELCAQFSLLLQRADEIESGGGKAVKAAPDRAVLAAMLDACNDYDIDRMQEAMDELEKYAYEEADGDTIAWLKEQLVNFAYDQIGEKLTESLA
jgi:CheY-like chemotaxis protein